MQKPTSLRTIRSEFVRIFGGKPRLFRAPGRMNIIGEHVDYNGGSVLPATIDRYNWAAAALRGDRVLDLYFCADSSRHEVALDDLSPGGRGTAVEYVKAVAWALQRAGLETPGCNLVIGGNLPLGSGLSSSAALELVLAATLTSLAGATVDAEQLAHCCHEAESKFVGMPCGIMDQYVVALGVPGQAMLLDCSSQTFDLQPLPAEAAFIITHCGVSHRLPEGGYNSRRDECRSALSVLGDIDELALLTPQRLQSERLRLGDTLYRRCRHVVTEVARVRAAVQALPSADLPALGALMNESHRSLRDDYEVSCEALDALVEIAVAFDAVLGSRMMGGGFGGCTISLVRRPEATNVARAISRDYGKLLGRDPWQHVVGPARPMAEVENDDES